MQLGMFVSPVAYSPKLQVPERYLGWYMLNPMASIVDGFRRVICDYQPPQWEYVIPAAGVALLFVWAGYWYFKHTEGRFADVL
jgi:lipopolysaccharide transport system permease protein